jgi:uncharacterized MnhB-related membrane protein
MSTLIRQARDLAPLAIWPRDVALTAATVGGALAAAAWLCSLYIV